MFVKVTLNKFYDINLKYIYNHTNMLKILKFPTRKIIRTITTIPKKKPIQQNLKKYFLDKIRINGPITVSEYMHKSLKMYYNSEKVFGSDGDFITSPEISQLYGEVSKY